MARRIIAAILFIPLCFVVVFIQMPFELLKWVVTGKDIGEPIVSTVIAKILKIKI